MSVRPRHLTYDIAGGQEQCLAFGIADATRKILIIPPLFDEMNRMRRVLVSAMRDLAGRNVAALLPDLPGCNESLAGLAAQDLDGWGRAIAAATAQHGATHIASLRGGCLIDGTPKLPVWRLSPAKGTSLLKMMVRTRIAGDKEAGLTTSADELTAAGRTAPVELAGNMISPAMLASLETAEPAPLDGLTLASLGADGVTGSALWLRAEPQDDPQMAASIADNLDRWSASCGG